VSKQKLQI